MMQHADYLTMPGRVLSMSVSGDGLFVLCLVDRRWWEFWKPRQYKRLVTLTDNDLAAVRTLGEGCCPAPSSPSAKPSRSNDACPRSPHTSQ